MTDNKVSLLGNKASVEKASGGINIATGEIGHIGLKISNGLIYEDLKKELTFPYSLETYKQMSYDPTIAAGLSFFEYMMLKTVWRVKPVEDATPEELEQTKIIKECMNDMDHTWQDFVQEVSSMNTHGFSVHEIVLRKRKLNKGSKYDDGLVGWGKLPIRSQDTIDKWIYSKDGRELVAVKQNFVVSGKSGAVMMNRSNHEVEIPRNKFLLFRTGKRRENPFGESILKSVYFAWKYRTTIEETEAAGVVRDLGGLPILMLPPQYMAEDASPEQKAIYEYYKNVVRNIQMNQQGGLVLPMAYDPETKGPLFKFELLSAEGGKAYDTNAIVNRYDNKILTSMGCDILIMGQSGGGSYALGSIKSTMTALAIESRLREICNVVNNHLIPLTAKYNGWNPARLPTLSFDDLEASNLEEWSKAIQRAASTGMIERDRPMLNKTREMLGVDPYAEDEPVHDELLTGATSKSGQGMQTPFEGTRTSDGGGNDNDGNADNIG